jgi:hypothetical protein
MRFSESPPEPLAEEPLVDLMPTVDELLDIKTETPEKKKKKKRKKKKTEEKRTSGRIRKKPQRYADVEWEKW